MKLFPFPDPALFPYRNIYYRVIGTLRGFSHTELHSAIKHAFGIWSAYTRGVAFKRTRITGDFNISFVPNTPDGVLGNAIIEIDTTEAFFLDKWRTTNSPGLGPFDLVAAISHEIGHRVFDGRHNTIPFSMMNESLGEMQVKRRLQQVDIQLAENVFGTEPSVFALRPLKLQDADQYIYAPNVQFRPTESAITISGAGGTISKFQIYSHDDFVGFKVNAINIRVNAFSSYAIINSIQVWDSLNLLEWQFLSLSSLQNDPQDLEIKIGFSAKPVISYGMLFRAEILFLDKFPAENEPNPHRVRKVEITSIEVEIIPPGLPDDVIDISF